MITEVIIRNTASYGENPTSLETDKKVNLIYGLNGTGKTIFSNYLKHRLDKEKFKNCSTTGFNERDQKILVYNQEFVDENFYISDTQKGIFTLAKDNKEALKKIEETKKEQKKLSKELEIEEKNLDDTGKKLKEELKIAAKDVWEIVTTYAGGDRIFDRVGFLDGLKGNKETLFEHLKKINVEDTNKNIEQIEKELQEIGKEATKRESIPLISFDELSKIEQDNIFEKEIIGSKNSVVFDLIEQLENSDWVKTGLDKYVNLQQSNQCPFCQQKTLTKELVNNIRLCFDTTYTENTERVKSLQKEYNRLKSSLEPRDYIRDFYTEDQKETISRYFSNVHNILAINLQNIQQKVDQPSQKVELKPTESNIKEINTFIEETNKAIKEYNKKLENREPTKQNLKKEFWKILRMQYNPTIKLYNKQNERFKKDKENIKEKIEELKQASEKQNAIIKDNQKKTTNIDEVIEKIKQHLLDFGIDYFSIKKHNDHEYKIQRNEETETKFKSLSEGEKTVISFLYFVEFCKGKETPDDTKDKIVVIDDPISSLSHMYVFNVAQMIKNNFFNVSKNEEKSTGNNFLQCFVLTHSLYFFNELIDRKKYNTEEEKPQKLFRIYKENSHSCISEMKYNEIQNEYQAYWSIIKDSNQNNVIVMANAMRNIIEYFFSFIDKSDSLNNIFQKKPLNNNKFQSFQRYIDRESHSDAMNISDYKEFNYEIFKDAFENIFIETKHTKHYQKMMGIKKNHK